MKLTKSKLKQIIKEELENVLDEGRPVPWQIPTDWRGEDRKSHKLLNLLRRGKWGSPDGWTAPRGSSYITGDKGFVLELMSMGDTLAVYVLNRETDQKEAEMYVKGSR
jgi:hypothetical protein